MIVGLSGLAGAGKDTLADLLVKHHGFVKVALADPIKRFAKEVFDFTDGQLWGPSELRNAEDTRYPRPRRRAQDLINALNKETGEGRVLHGALQASLIAEEPQRYLTPRHALQSLGSEWGRACYEDVWVNYCLWVADRLLHPEKYIAENARHLAVFTYDARTGLRIVDEPPISRPLGVVIPDVRFGNELDAIHKAGGRVIRVIRKGAGLEGAAGQHVSETVQASIPNEAFDRALINLEGRFDLLERLARDIADGSRK